jgi:hypothetical protein
VADLKGCHTAEARHLREFEIPPLILSASLKVASVMRFDKIATLDKRIILCELGRIEASALHAHRRGFLGDFGF